MSTNTVLDLTRAKKVTITKKQIELLIEKPMTVTCKFENGTAQQKEYIGKAIDMVEQVINKPEFRRSIIEKNGGFTQTTKTNYWHLKSLVEGNERGLDTTDYEMDFIIRFYFTWKGVIGYTNYGSIKINLNTKFTNRSIPPIVNTLVHEYTHLVGHHHSYKRSYLWPNTAPYWIGNKAQQIAEEIMGIEKTKRPVIRRSLFGRFLLWAGRIV